MREEPFCRLAPGYYVSIRYGSHLMGLLVETDDEEEAWREAQEVCGAFGDQARLLDVRKVVIQ